MRLPDIYVLVHPPQYSWVYWKHKLRSSFQPPLDALEGCLKTKVVRGKVVAQGSVNVLDTAHNILAVAIGACVGHQLHEDAQALWFCWEGVQTEEVGKIKPLPYVRQNVVLC